MNQSFIFSLGLPDKMIMVPSDAATISSLTSEKCEVLFALTAYLTIGT